MSLAQYRELSLQEQIPPPKTAVSRALFNLRIIFSCFVDGVFGRSNFTPLERQLITDNTTFFDHHIQRHCKYEDFGEFGEIYHLVIPKHDDPEFHSNSSDPIVVFIHGLGGNLHQFDEQFNALYLKHNVMSFDLPGSGNSTLKHASYKLSLTNFTRFVLEFLEKKEVIDRNFIFVGHSYGTQVVIDLVHHLNGKQVQKVILIAPPKFPALKSFSGTVALSMFHYFPILFDIFRKVDRINNINGSSLKRLFSTTKFDTLDDFLKFKQFKFNLQTNSKNFLSHIINWKPIELDELVASINHLKTSDDFQKILIIDGSEDKVTKDGGSTYKSILADAVDYRLIDKAGHNMLLDSFKELNEILEAELVRYN